MKSKWSIRKEFKIGAILVMVSFLIAFSERKQGGAVCKDILVELENRSENHFLDEADILHLVETSGQPLKGTAIGRIKLKEIETRLKLDKHVKEAELFGDHKGNLIVRVELRRPIARVMQEDGPDAYISEEGVVMGISDKFTSRVVVISGRFVKRILEKGDMNAFEEGKKLMEMIEYINEEPFWKAQIAQMDVNAKGEITIYPQVTGQLVEFGTPDQYETKLRKLLIFYKEILPQKGWTKYERVNLKYEGQVIAQ